MARAQAFYEAVLQTTLASIDAPDKNLTMLGFSGDMEAPGCSGALVHTPELSAGVGGTLVYFCCEDCSNEESRVANAGGAVVQSKMAIGEYGFIALAKDTEGNIVGFHSTR
ncbi:VOC family protein [Salinimonas marina]|uniref:VOC family protein n=1 Tax=Salinimonas marina TaxID=2785918 RepID=A0A7S9DZ93_9ALTE|nr:VOC family protein [Salinimonas marina]QPG06668.1 VOC family protein [Salinimonas marina]